MRDFVPNHRADRAVIHRIIQCEIKKRRLQNAGGKNDFVSRPA